MSSEPLEATIVDDESETLDLDSEQSYSSGDDPSLEAIERGWGELLSVWRRDGIPEDVPFARLPDLIESAASFVGQETSGNGSSAFGDDERIQSSESGVLSQRRPDFFHYGLPSPRRNLLERRITCPPPERFQAARRLRFDQEED